MNFILIKAEMIKSINLFNYIKTNTIQKFRKYSGSFRFNLPKLIELKHDLFEYRKGMPEVLTYSPQIYEGKYPSGIKDNRFLLFETEYKAYDFEGYDNIFPNNYVCIDSIGDRRLKPHIYLKIAEIKPEFARQGAYTSAIKKLVNTAKNDIECEGRITLEAHKIEGPLTAHIPSPSLAHWKCGFRFANEENNKIMKRVLNGELSLEAAPEGTMYYPLP